MLIDVPNYFSLLPSLGKGRVSKTTLRTNNGQNFSSPIFLKLIIVLPRSILSEFFNELLSTHLRTFLL